jgi:hypothetical protein
MLIRRMIFMTAGRKISFIRNANKDLFVAYRGLLRSSIMSPSPGISKGFSLGTGHSALQALTVAVNAAVKSTPMTEGSSVPLLVVTNLVKVASEAPAGA